MKNSMLVGLVILVVALLNCSSNNEWTNLTDGPDLAAWQKDHGEWFEAGDAFQNSEDEKLISTKPGNGIIVNDVDGRTKNLFSLLEHGDCELHVEFMVPKGSNSGVYLMGRYEVQVLDSWGVTEPQHGDCGGIYQRYVEEEERGYGGHPPRVNASLPPGEWQKFDISFKGPRFDQSGNKTENAKFIKVVHNGIVVHENVELTGPTRSAAFEHEKPTGPLMLQGDHGPVAYRNIRMKML